MCNAIKVLIKLNLIQAMDTNISPRQPYKGANHLSFVGGMGFFS